jgi:arylsulfatase A-like enzyme
MRSSIQLRRLLRSSCAAWLGLLAILFAITQPSSADATERPNIVLIISDDQHWGDYGFMGHPHIRTPHLDRLASQSLVFPRGYVPSSLCCPSLASIITGRYPHEHKITSNDPPNPDALPAGKFYQSQQFRDGREVMNRFMDAQRTLPRLLVQHGYLALQTGKWWQGDYRHGGFTHGMTQGARHGDDGLDIGRKTMLPIYDFISTARQERKPFFVWYAPMMPHEPHNPPQRLLDHYTNLAPAMHIAKYWAMIEWFDETCGQLLDHLDQQDLATNTIVAFLADNGWITDPVKGSYAPKSKQSPYDGGLRTPIMFRWPGKVAPARSLRLASSLDLLPTLLKAARLPSVKHLPGINLLDSAAVQKRSRLFGECFTHSAVDLNDPARNLRWRWMIEGVWKLLVPWQANEPTATVELYNVVADTNEKTNLAAARPDKVAGLRRKLDEWWNPEVTPPAEAATKR